MIPDYYLIFAYNKPNESGGWANFKSSHTSLTAAAKIAVQLMDVYDVVDLVRLKDFLPKEASE